MKKSIQLLRAAGLSAFLAASVSAPAFAAGFELTHSEGVIVDLNKTPQRIVSYDLAVLDSLEALGVQAVGVPKSTYQDALVKYNESPVVGTLFEPDYDALVALQPDLLFAGGRSAKAIPELEKIAPTATYNADPTTFLDDFRKNNLALATAFGQTEIAQQAIEQIEHNVAQLQEANQGKTGAFLFVINDNVIAQAPGDRFGYTYDVTGLQSILPAKDPNEPMPARPKPGSPEAKKAAEKRAQIVKGIAEAEPDWLIVLDRGAIGGASDITAKQTIDAHPELNQTAAYKAGRVYYVDPVNWYIVGGGLNNFKNITDDLVSTMR